MLIAIHLLIAMYHTQVAAHFKSEYGARTFAAAGALAFTDAPRGTAEHDNLQWPPGQFMSRPVAYMRVLSVLDLVPFILLAAGQPDLAFLAMLLEKSGGVVDHLYMYGGTTGERLKTIFPVLTAWFPRVLMLMACRAPAAASGGRGVVVDAAALVAAAVLVGVAIRPFAWLVGGVRPASRARPGRKQTPYAKKA